MVFSLNAQAAVCERNLNEPFRIDNQFHYKRVIGQCQEGDRLFLRIRTNSVSAAQVTARLCDFNQEIVYERRSGALAFVSCVYKKP